MLDDDKPDYFLADETTGKPGNNKSAEDKSGNTIDFGTGTDSDSNSNAGNSPQPAISRHRGRKILAWTVAIGVIILGIAFYMRYCNPYAEDAAMRCYIVNVEKRGIIFKTYEAQAVSAESIADTSRIYSYPENFSVKTEQVARQMQQYQGTNTPVTLRYEKFYATLPWRGASKMVVTSVEPG